MGVGLVIVDAPPLDALYPWVPDVSAHASWRTYVRAHGRNLDWFTAGNQRYNYTYSDAELHALAKAVEPLRRPAGQTLMFFNNSHMSASFRNAMTFQKVLLGRPRGAS